MVPAHPDDREGKTSGKKVCVGAYAPTHTFFPVFYSLGCQAQKSRPDMGGFFVPGSLENHFAAKEAVSLTPHCAPPRGDDIILASGKRKFL
jgi:hypothetical protein